MTDNGDQYLRDAGIVLPCAKQFGFVGWRGAGSSLSHCDRPYGHTGPHSVEGLDMRGARDAEDEARTANVLSLILKAGVE